MKRDIPWLRVGIEMVVIVVSILLAFGIEAWWQSGQERKAVAELKELLRVQMTANVELLDADIEEALQAEASLSAAVQAISPNPGPITADSLWTLIGGGWDMLDQNVEISAVDRVLGLESFDPTEQPALYRQMIAFRGQAERLGDNVDRFVTVKMRARDYMRSVTPLPTLMYADPDSGVAFPVPVDQLLTDPQLESLLKELYERQRVRRSWANDLRSLADSIANSLASAG